MTMKEECLICILQKHAGKNHENSVLYEIPVPFNEVFLFKKITHIDLIDLLADRAVRFS